MFRKLLLVSLSVGIVIQPVGRFKVVKPIAYCPDERMAQELEKRSK